MNAYGFIVLAALLAAPPALAGTIVVPADVSVSLAAEPSVGLESGQPITFTVSATNHGPDPVGSVGMLSSEFTTEFNLSGASSDCEGLGLIVADGDGFYYYKYYRSVTSGIPLEVGETRSCHLTLPLSSSAPEVWTFGFEIPTLFVDLDPTNNSASVTLRRGFDVVRPIPTLSPLVLILLASLLATAGVVARRARP